DTNALNAGDSVTDIFTYTIKDSDDDLSHITVTITVSGENQPPIPPYNPVGSVDGIVFDDLNGDGHRNSDENGLGGVVVTLVNDNGFTVGSTVTSSSGYYSFSSIPTGGYTVHETDPDDYVSTTSNTVPIVVYENGLATANFGDRHASGDVAGIVFNDMNGNGLQDADENGIAGVTIELLDNSGNITANVATDRNGSYIFSDIAPGDYKIRETDPSGFVSTTADLVTLSVNTGETSTADFGDRQTGSVDGIVFNDMNGDGVQDADEPGLSGVVIELLDSDNEVIMSTVASIDGSYTFPNVVEGDYTVRETDPASYISITDNLVTVSVNAGITSTVDFGDQQTGTIDGTVFDDINGNGTQDAGESGISGVVIELLDSDGNVVMDTTTSGVGTYTFSDIIKGVYTIHETDPSGFTSTTGNIVPVTISGGSADIVDFGDQQTGTISGTVFNDINGNGVQDAGEVGIGGVTVQLEDVYGDMKTVVTDDNGSYIFTGILEGIYTVHETDPSGYISTTANSASVIITEGSAATASFGDQQTGTISGIVFDDINGNGVQDAGESGIGGVTVELTGDNGDVRTIVTSGNGSYVFTEVLEGNYTVREIDPSGFTSTTANSASVTVEGNGAGIANFGDQQTGTISGVVFNDINGNGVQDAGEDGIGGVTVELVDENGDVKTVITAGNGSYVFTGVSEGSYTVREIDPSGFTSTTSNSTSVTVTGDGAATASFGDQTTGTISGIVFNDENGNGVQDEGESGIGGVTVELDDGAGTVTTVITAGNGSYIFIDVTEGDYTIREIDPGDFISTTSNGFPVTVADGGAATANFGDQEEKEPDMCKSSKAVVDINGGAIKPGDALWYGVSLYNSGDEDATDVIYTDIPGFNTSIVPGSITTTKGEIVRGNEEGEGDIEIDVGTVAPGESVVISYYVQVDDDVSRGDWIQTQGLISGSNFQDEPTDYPDTAAINDPTVIGPVDSLGSNADVRAGISAEDINGGATEPGDIIEYTVTLKNNGRSDDYNDAHASIELFNGYNIIFEGAVYNSDGTSTWRYTVEELPDAKDMSNWLLELPECVKVMEATAGFELISPDPNTGLSGIKWDVDDQFESGNFSITLDRHWQQGIVEVAAKGGSDIGAGQIVGPVCHEGELTDIYFTNSVPAYTTLVAGSVKSSRGTVDDGDPFKISINDFAPDETATITFRVMVDENIPGDHKIINQGMILGARDILFLNDGGMSLGIDDSAEIQISGETQFIESFQTVIDYNGETVYPKDVLEYKATIVNSGGVQSANLMFSETLVGFVSLLSGTVGNTQGTVISGNEDGDTSVVVNVGELGPGERAIITFQAVVADDAPNSAVISSQGRVIDTESSDGRPVDMTDDPYTCTPDQPTVEVVMWDPNAFDPPGAEKRFSGDTPVVHWEMFWINDKNEDALLVHVEDGIPAGVTYVEGSVGADYGDFWYDASANKIVWEGEIPGNGGQVNVWYDTSVPANIIEIENQGCAVWDQNGDGDWTDEAAEGLKNICTDDPGTNTPGDGTIWKGCPLSVGDMVWLDENQDGIYQPDREKGFDGVIVNIYEDTDGNGLYTSNKDKLVKSVTTVTHNGNPGHYLFEELCPGSYIVQIAPENFDSGVLEGYASSPGSTDSDDDIDNDDNGYFISGHGVVSRAVTLSRDNEPANDGDTNPLSNRTVDFGFYEDLSSLFPVKPF
ncbi:SdrD B-like domain-containing protein, partial [Desulfobacterales bacterium HSG16]|nr:SdrD B-like domain-containing protein [Desulfobacterales bacterium HSG16]